MEATTSLGSLENRFRRAYHAYGQKLFQLEEKCIINNLSKAGSPKVVNEYVQAVWTQHFFFDILDHLWEMILVIFAIWVISLLAFFDNWEFKRPWQPWQRMQTNFKTDVACDFAFFSLCIWKGYLAEKSQKKNKHKATSFDNFFEKNVIVKYIQGCRKVHQFHREW